MVLDMQHLISVFIFIAVYGVVPAMMAVVAKYVEKKLDEANQAVLAYMVDILEFIKCDGEKGDNEKTLCNVPASERDKLAWINCWLLKYELSTFAFNILPLAVIAIAAFMAPISIQHIHTAHTDTIRVTIQGVLILAVLLSLFIIADTFLDYYRVKRHLGAAYQRYLEKAKMGKYKRAIVTFIVARRRVT